MYAPKTKYSSHYGDVIMGAMASQITSLTIVYSTVYSGADQTKHQSSASLAFVRGIHRGPVNSPRKWPVTRKMFPFDDVIMTRGQLCIPQQTESSLSQIMASRPLGAKQLSESMLTYCQLEPLEQMLLKFESKYTNFHTKKIMLQCVK